jgi:hypothetical protein
MDIRVIRHDPVTGKTVYNHIVKKVPAWVPYRDDAQNSLDAQGWYEGHHPETDHRFLLINTETVRGAS